MLTNFFKLNGTFVSWTDAQLELQLNNATKLNSFLYSSDNWISRRKLEGITFENASLSKTVFQDCTFKSCEFRDCLFIGSTFKNVEFHKCKFENCNFYKCKFEGCYIDPRAFIIHRSYRKTHANIGVDLYHQLYDNSSNLRMSQFAMESDIEFRRWKRWQLEYDLFDNKIGPLEKIAKKVSSLGYEFICGFGYKPLRFIIVTLILFLLLSFFNKVTLSGSLSSDGKSLANIDLVDSIFYTFSMMTCLGFSIITPISNFAKLLAVSEALAGIGWLGIFTSLLVKRFIR